MDIAAFNRHLLQHFREEELAIIQTLDIQLYLSDFAEIQ